MPPSGSQQSISTCPSSPDDPKDRNLGLDENSIDINNAYIVSQISQEMERKGVISAPLDMLNVVELDLAMDTIMHNTHFKKMDVKYGSLLSRALKRFRYDRNTNVTVTDHRAQELEIQDTTLSQTEREAIVLSRIGQGLFRKKLLDKYQGRCIITGINQPRLLVASHIKPWAASNNLERLSVDNGLLLSATYDRLFDSGLITFHSSGKLYLSSSLDPENAARLHLCEGDCYALMTTNKMIQFLEYHADCIFLK